MSSPLFNWQMPGWPRFSFDRAALRDELAAFSTVFRAVRKAVAGKPADPEAVARSLAAEAVTTSAIEGVDVDARVVMSSICRALGVPAPRDLAELERTGAIVAHGDGPQIHYRLNCSICEPVDPINDPINGKLEEHVFRAVANQPGTNRNRIARKVGRSVETVKRAIAALVAAGRIEHRGSKKTGGYYPLSPSPHG